MSVLSVALKREEWEVAALCLLLGLAQTRLPPDAVLGLVEMAEGGAPESAPRPAPELKRGSRYAPQAG